MWKNMPPAVQYARVINIIFIVVLIAIGLLITLIGLPNLFKAANIRFYNPMVRFILFLLFVAIGLIPAYLVARLNKALLRLDKKAYKAQIILSIILGIIGFPLYTVLYGTCIYLFTRPAVKEQFK